MKIIERKCIVKKIKVDRRLLFRIVRTPSEVIVIDQTYQMQGRGAYLSKDKKAIEIAKKKNLLARALRCNIDTKIYDELLNNL